MQSHGEPWAEGITLSALGCKVFRELLGMGKYTRPVLDSLLDIPPATLLNMACHPWASRHVLVRTMLLYCSVHVSLLARPAAGRGWLGRWPDASRVLADVQPRGGGFLHFQEPIFEGPDDLAWAKHKLIGKFKVRGRALLSCRHAVAM